MSCNALDLVMEPEQRYGCVCRSMKGYEEVSVPAVRPAAPPPGEELVKITDMEEWAQLAFAGYK